ncbi:peptidase [Staphylococcus sp. GSSP0090]|nr:peptidase [Staphylococcus sp. GSSP0090]
MKISKILLASTLASSIALVGVQGAANAEEGAKTVWGGTLPSSTDPDGNGWANVDFDASVLPQSYQEEIRNLTLQKDTNKLSQVEYNEQVASIYEKAKQEQQAHTTKQGDRPYGGVTPDGMTNEEYAELEKNVPNPNEVSNEEYSQAVENETARIQNNGKETTANNAVGITEKSNVDTQELPETGSSEENTVLNITLGILTATLGLSAILFSRKANRSN